MVSFGGKRSQSRTDLVSASKDASSLQQSEEGFVRLDEDAKVIDRLAEEHGLSERQLKKLSRVELLEIMVEQAKLIDNLKDQLEHALDQVTAQRVALQQIVAVSQASLGIEVDAQSAQEALAKYASDLEKARVNAVELNAANSPSDLVTADSSRPHSIRAASDGPKARAARAVPDGSKARPVRAASDGEGDPMERKAAKARHAAHGRPYQDEMIG